MFDIANYMKWLDEFMTRRKFIALDSEAAMYETIFRASDTEEDRRNAKNLSELVDALKKLHVKPLEVSDDGVITIWAIRWKDEDFLLKMFRGQGTSYRISRAENSVPNAWVCTEKPEEPIPFLSFSERMILKVRKWFEENGLKTAVIGISGGKDSAVVAAMCVKALGKNNVFGVLMPNGKQKDIQDSYQVVNTLEIPYMVVDISAAVQGVYTGIQNGHPDTVEISKEASYNIPARIRTNILRTIAQSLNRNAVVVGTGNRAEIFIGYFTKGGDGDSDFNPLANLWVDQVIQIGDEIGLFPNIIHKSPADGLCGYADEERLGFSYDQVKRYAFYGADSVPQAVAKRIAEWHNKTAHKRVPIPTIDPDD